MFLTASCGLNSRWWCLSELFTLCSWQLANILFILAWRRDTWLREQHSPRSVPEDSLSGLINLYFLLLKTGSTAADLIFLLFKTFLFVLLLTNFNKEEMRYTSVWLALVKSCRVLNKGLVYWLMTDYCSY